MCFGFVTYCGVLAQANLKLFAPYFVQELSTEPVLLPSVSKRPICMKKPDLRRHLLPKTAHDASNIQRLQRLLSSSMMQNNDSAWTRQRQRDFIESRIEALEGTPREFVW